MHVELNEPEVTTGILAISYVRIVHTMRNESSTGTVHNHSAMISYVPRITYRQRTDPWSHSDTDSGTVDCGLAKISYRWLSVI